MTRTRLAAFLAMAVVVSVVTTGVFTWRAGHPRKISSEQVVKIATAPYPEGPTPDPVTRTDPRATAMFALLPAQLPTPLRQGDCQVGNVTTLTLADGTVIEYGPCRRPPSIDALRCALAGKEPGCSPQPSS